MESITEAWQKQVHGSRLEYSWSTGSADLLAKHTCRRYASSYSASYSQILNCVCVCARGFFSFFFIVSTFCLK